MIGRTPFGFNAVEPHPCSREKLLERLRVFFSQYEPTTALVPVERIARHIVVLRGEKVMLDADLAELYGVETKVLNQAVQRNAERFPADFMFQLTDDEAANLRSQSVTSSSGHGGRRTVPYAFTEQGIAMLSSVLRSDRAVQVNIVIMRAFVSMRRLIGSHAALAKKIAELESKYDGQFRIVFDALRDVMADTDSKRRKPPIGFLTEIGITKKSTKTKRKKTR